MKKFLIILCIPLIGIFDCSESVDLLGNCISTTVECGSISLGGVATYPLYFNINNDEGEQCYYKPDSYGVFGNYAYVSNDKCDCDCVRLYEGDD